MADKTKNYNLTKPSTTDYIDIKVINDNYDTIDGIIPPIRKKKITVKTTSEGNVDLQLELEKAIILTAVTNMNVYIAVPYVSNGKWYASIITNKKELTKLTNFSITLDIYYLDVSNDKIKIEEVKENTEDNSEGEDKNGESGGGGGGGSS